MRRPSFADDQCIRTKETDECGPTPTDNLGEHRSVRERTVGRLCIIDHGYPLAIPINYQVVGSNDDINIVVRTAPETMLGRYEGPGSLEVDDIDLDHGTAWSVIVRGAVRRVLGTHNLPDPNPMITDRREKWITLHMSAVSRRRFAVRKASDGLSVDWQLATA